MALSHENGVVLCHSLALATTLNELKLSQIQPKLLKTEMLHTLAIMKELL